MVCFDTSVAPLGLYKFGLLAFYTPVAPLGLCTGQDVQPTGVLRLDTPIAPLTRMKRKRRFLTA